MVESGNIIEEKRQKYGKVLLHLGCGYEYKQEHINIDKNIDCSKADIYQDATDLSNFADNSVDEILTYHMIEHIGHRRLVPTFIEWRRVLKPDGKIIFECPNLSTVIEQFAKLKANSGEIMGDFGDNSVYETLYGGQKDEGSFHISCVTAFQLMCILKAAGFEDEKIKREIPLKGKEYGIDWNLRFVVEK